MERGQRIGFAAVAVLIALVAVVLLTRTSDEPRRAAARSATGESAGSPASSPTPNPSATATPAPELVRFRGGQVVGGPAVLRFEQGERARFTVASDIADEVHVHGYDIKRDVAAGGTASFSFPASIEGIFEVELEGRGVQLAQVRVDP